MRLRPILLASILSIASPSFASDEPATTSADAALAALQAGNARFAAGESTFPRLDQARRCETTERGEHPIAAILSCADSRVPPELVFDAGLGDVFAIRVAGNVAGADEIATLEYGAAHLGTPLIVVMGHSKCGAVSSVVQHADVEPNLAKLVAPIAPAVEEARAQNPNAAEARLIPLAIKANVRRAMHDVLEQSGVIRALVESNKVRLVGAVYDVHNGTVEWLSDVAVASKATDEEAKPIAHRAEAPATVGHDVAKPATHEEAPAKPQAAVTHGEMLHDAKPAPHGLVESHETGDPHARTESHGSPPSHEPTSSHQPTSPHEKSDAHEKADAHAEDPHASAAEPEAKSLVARQGLLVPAAFMAAGSALSGTIVYALKSRPQLAAAAPHVEPAPASH